MRRVFIVVFMLLMLLIACTPVPTGQVTSNLTDPFGDPLQAPPAVVVNSTENSTTLLENTTPDYHYVKTAVEGDVIELKPIAFDQDNNTLNYSFSAPFDAKGRWSTKIGDEGRYFVNISVSDGNTTTNETIVVLVTRANRPPVISCDNITLDEGQMVDLSTACTVTDDDNTSISYSGWMTGPTYQTTFNDAGTHDVLLTVRDMVHTVKHDVLVFVRDVKRPPVFADDFPSELSATEGDVVMIPHNATDPDGPVQFAFSKPFTQDGIWHTAVGDAGSYDIIVTASNGNASTEKHVLLKIGLLNTAPVLAPIANITVKEGETIKLPISATDREGDNITITIEGWMTERTYKTTYDDAGLHVVKVTASDGLLNTTELVQINVEDVNRPPVFIIPA